MITSERGKITDLDNWTIIAEDIFLTDVGSAGYTAYEVDKGAFKAADIVELFEAFPGLEDGIQKNHHIHTHHNMGAFMSGTDWSQLNDRGRASNYFMMLVVDCVNPGVRPNHNGWVAHVAFPASIKQFRKKYEQVGDKRIEFTHNLDGLNPMIMEVEEKETTIEGDDSREVLCVMDCTIVKEAMDELPLNPFQDRYRKVVASLAAATPVYNSGASYHARPVTGTSGYSPRGAEIGANTRYKEPQKGPHGGNVWEQGELGLGPDTTYWEDREAEEKGEKGSRKKNIGDMTDSEYMAWSQEEYGNSRIKEPYRFDSRHVRAFINAWMLEYVGIQEARMDFSDPIPDLIKLDRKPRWQVDAKVEDFTSDLREWTSANFQGCTNTEYMELLAEMEKFLYLHKNIDVVTQIYEEELKNEIDGTHEEILEEREKENKTLVNASGMESRTLTD